MTARQSVKKAGRRAVRKTAILIRKIVMKAPCFLMILLLATTGLNKAGPTYQAKEPITQERLITLLVNDVPISGIIQAIKERGVSFQTFQPFVDEIKQAGKNLSARQFEALLSAISDNYRPPAIAPYRVSFMTLQGVAPNLLLDKKIDKVWDKALGSGYFLVRNNVYKS